LATLGAWAAPGHATETQLWITDSPADYARAEARGVLVGADGVLTLGPRAASSPADSLDVIWAIAILHDGSVALAGDDGRIERWTESGGVRPWVRLPVGQVLSLAPDGDGVVAGTGPGGVVYRVGARGDTSVVARTGERYVWGLAPAGRPRTGERSTAWYAATGTKGRVMRLEGGRARIVLDTEESNLVSMISDGQGGAYAGGDSKGRVVHVRADGSARTVYDAAEDEIRALALGPGGSVYAAGLSAAAVSVVADAADDDRPGVDSEDRPQPARSAPATGGRAVIYRIVPDSSAAQLWAAPQPFIYALLAEPGPRGKAAADPPGLLAATGNRAGVYRISARGFGSQWVSAPQGQITALAADGRGRVFAASSNPGALWRLGPEPAERGELMSSVLDARRFARFGRVRWRGDDGGGRVEVETRSGNTDTPDTTWTPWSASAPSARYFQWKLGLRGGAPRIDAVETAWREQNLPPRVEDLTVAPQGIGFREGELQPRTEPVTQTLPGGMRVEYSLPSQPVGRALRELPAWARGMRTIQWRASDPNGDPLRYRVDVRAENEDAWIELGKDLDASSFTWESLSLPDGRYRIRVIASDATGNPVDEELTGEALSEPFSIDNTAPSLTSLEAKPAARAVEVSGRAEDGASMLTRLELSVDDGDWRVVSPEGGLADARVLEFHTRLADLAPGVHTIAVRAIDIAGNSTVRALRVTVPPRR